MKEIKKIDATDIKSYEEALNYLKRENEAFMLGVFSNAKALIAIEKLITIAEAWNKLDGFVPDFDDLAQDKWFPRFQKQGTAGFVAANTDYTASGAFAHIGSRLCFKTEERAEQFGKQFVDLWNDFLL